MTVTYTCSFEFDTAPPITTRGRVVASSMPTCFARAARQAAKAHPGLRWTSMVIVLLERVDEAAATESVEQVDDERDSVPEPVASDDMP